jgi:pantetheine-phosphate adenylyltransferase
MDKKIRVGVYAGSFNPLHKGHMDVAEQAKQLFDTLIILKAYNDDKDENDDYFLYHKMRTMLAGKDMQLEILGKGKLLTDFIKELEVAGLDVTLVRGLRNGADLDYEQNKLYFMKKLKPDLKTIFILSNHEFLPISSSAIRTLFQLKQDAIAQEMMP